MLKTKKETVYLLEEFKNYVPYLPLIADLIGADLYLYQPITDLSSAVLVAEAHPKTVPPLSIRQEIGKLVFFDDEPELLQAINTGRVQNRKSGLVIGGFPAEEEVLPLKKDGRVIGVLKVLKNLLVHTEFPYNARGYKETSQWLLKLLIKGKLNWEGFIDSVSEGESILILDEDGIVLFANMAAMKLFRTLGEVGNIWGKKVKDPFFYKFIEMRKDMEFIKAWGEEVYEEFEDETRSFVKRILPVSKGNNSIWRMFYLIRETTELKQKERELKFKSVLIKEIHHRVKNNLQTIASLLRIQMRRLDSESAKLALQESINRVNSIALVHESLSRFEEDRVDIVEVAERLLNAFKQTYEDLPCIFKFHKSKKNIFLSSQKATSVSLIVNELLQNAVKHGVVDESPVEIVLSLTLQEKDIILEVTNKGAHEVQISEISPSKGSLGFQLVQMLVEEIKGKIDMEAFPCGLRIKVTFPKGEEIDA
ncbi:MAG TPA: histidine kinase N-terminal domain-containing protein [Dictyoglomaceae bacterium]|nr:histidine kinase N-terminal domain-containing protein [Dictyoglomaceae bacterium]HOL38744.1 histidine kinase N-terminal domain-containing protein [Dictyoglomaceae bacterium]HOP94552.1 histidine kinase N-terminal domain-containing protein [Dictyoglomaceae bacterium]HPP15507.1 histidine kinase N-terminal domain-containing protein [Dictyoglomaceae bacterium]HPU43084.1 histidine kinase N-terminal domain-containing protein [Dictyoglomaceae bacterium]